MEETGASDSGKPAPDLTGGSTDRGFTSQSPETDLIELPIRSVVSSETHCFVCGSRTQHNIVPSEVRMQAFVQRRLFVPENNRCCQLHLIRNKLFVEDLGKLRVSANSALIDKQDLFQWFERSHKESGARIMDKIGRVNLTDEQILLFTGLDYHALESITETLTSMFDLHSREIVRALLIFLFKMRTGSSNETIAAFFGLESHQQVSEMVDSVIDSFEEDVLPQEFGFPARDREYLIQFETSALATTFFPCHGSTNSLSLIYDGSSFRYERDAYSCYQKKSCPVQKKPGLWKTFTICTTTGYVVDVLGPFSADLNDAQIMEIAIGDPAGLGGFLRPGDVCFLDRGFRDVLALLEQKGLTVHIPALKGASGQLPTEGANHSRLVSKIRWAVEAVQGTIRQKYRIFDHGIDNDLRPKIGTLMKIACFLINSYGKSLRSDQTLFDEVAGRMHLMRTAPNTLAQEVEQHGWNRAQKSWSPVTCNSVPEFPELTEEDLKILFAGTYQLSQSAAYLAEMLNDDNTLNMKYHPENSSVLELEVPSRHVKSRSYRCYIDYVPESFGFGAIKRYWCQCANGSRTLGCCSHVAAVVFFLSYAKGLSKILRPAEILNLFSHDNAEAPVIEDDSDDD